MSIPCLALLVGWLLDLALGDPPRMPHPVVWFGKWIALWERRLNLGRHRIARGAVLAVASILGVYAISDVVVRLLAPYPVANAAVQSVAVFYCLAGHTLRKEVKATFAALGRGVEEGRRQVSRIVGRDTAVLSPQEVRTAALETLAENLSDGVVAPLFFLALLGVPGMLAYKMVNTLDSMLGYRTERYRLFGRWAARIDDVANLVPSRLTALLVVVAGWLCSKARHALLPYAPSFVAMRRFVLRYGPMHASPNSGWPEAALAALLNCRFGGVHDYFGETVGKPYIGENPRPLVDGDMRASLAVCLSAECLAVLLCLVALVA